MAAVFKTQTGIRRGLRDHSGITPRRFDPGRSDPAEKARHVHRLVHSIPGWQGEQTATSRHRAGARQTNSALRSKHGTRGTASAWGGANVGRAAGPDCAVADVQNHRAAARGYRASTDHEGSDDALQSGRTSRVKERRDPFSLQRRPVCSPHPDQGADLRRFFGHVLPSPSRRIRLKQAAALFIVSQQCMFFWTSYRRDSQSLRW